MKIVVLSSSSSGNCTFIELDGIRFLVDAGLGFNDIKNKLFDIGEEPEKLDFIIVTHAHNDHVKSIHSFNRVYNTKIYIGEETFNEYAKKDLIKNYEFVDNLSEIMGIRFTKIPISHDKKGYGYVFENDKVSIVYMTDTGMIHYKYYNRLLNKTYYLLESNHDVEMEMNGTKDQMTKLRNIGDMGHLSNEDCAKYLNYFIGNNTKYIYLIHISDHDNTHEKPFHVNSDSLDKNIKIFLKYKDKISEKLEV